MGCQREITLDIIDKEADYILAVKENQAQLHQDIEDEFRFRKKPQEDLGQYIDHERIETRKCSAVSDFKFINPEGEWKGIKSVIRIESVREFKN